MQIKVLSDITPEPEHMLGHMARLSHVREVVDPGVTLVKPGGEPVVIFGDLPPIYDDIRQFLKTVKYQNNIRLARMKVGNRNERSSDISFGLKQPNPVYSIAASACVFNNMYPPYYERLTKLGLDLINDYKKYAPEKYEYHRSTLASSVQSDWVIPGTVFTQGIINNSNRLNYHYDRGNFDNFWSCMAVFAEGMSGGELVIPSLGVALRVRDNCYVLFNGQAHIHGVTHIHKAPGGFRYSIVYYALKKMRGCVSQAEEIEKARRADMNKHLGRLK